ncbi:MAG TPA: sodium:proton antiporter NhaD [Flavisolibacter sp.]|jgi:Na+/H+ antiporter NhaD/arsenite permease-like protein|nr:sodium:proton antiporter NhaD [Flavisolibacter sp.]
MAIAIIITFILGYAAIAFEHTIKVNKAATALVTGVLCWTIYIIFQTDKHLVSEQLMEHLGEVSGILFFLLGAMTIVELIDLHDGFTVITDKINTKSAVKMLWIVSFITFFLSALLDNLTTTIVIVSLVRKLIADKNQRLFFVGITIIAANAGGAWSPLGDVTTTMLWIGGQVTALNIIKELFLPSLFCLLVPLLIISFTMKGAVEAPTLDENEVIKPAFERNFVFFLGVAILIFVPVFKTITHLPPFMAILFGLGVMWIITELVHNQRGTPDKDNLSVASALRKVDTPSILFFLGILISISALQATGQLSQLAQWLTNTIKNETVIITSIGLFSSIVDNVPLVAASQGMYSLDQYPTDAFFWQFLAYATGTGGSALIIGSAAGVAAMGMEKITFFWYLKRISWLALIGYFSGALLFLLQYHMMH